MGLIGTYFYLIHWQLGIWQVEIQEIESNTLLCKEFANVSIHLLVAASSKRNHFGFRLNLSGE
jgi:hypothetical protein